MESEYLKQKGKEINAILMINSVVYLFFIITNPEWSKNYFCRTMQLFGIINYIIAKLLPKNDELTIWDIMSNIVFFLVSVSIIVILFIRYPD